MAYSIEFIEEKEYLLAAVNGEIQTYEELAAKAQSIMEKAVKCHRKRVLVDDRGLSVNVDFFDAQRLAQDMEQDSLQTRGFRIACLCLPETRDSYRVFETNHQNRSLNFRAFMDLEAALEWLK